MRNEGLGSWPVRRARRSPDRIALIHKGGSVTYGELCRRVRRLTHALRGLGVRRGDRVAYLGSNHPSFLETLFATGMFGGVFVGLNPRLTAPEIAYQLTDSGSSVLLYATAHEALVRSLPAAPRVSLPLSGYEDLLAGASDHPFDESVALGDIGVIMYTSGTTGRPKGATLTHGNITWNALNCLVDTDLTSRDVALVTAPLFHTAGLNMLALPVLLKGGACVVVPSFDPDASLDLIERHRVTFMFGVPTMFERIARSSRWERADLSSLRILTCGGSAVPPSLIATYQARGLILVQGYGMTEAAPGVLYLDAAHTAGKAGSAGTPHFFTDVRVVGADRADLPPGKVGEVIVQGPNVMHGYWGLPEETAEVIADGWFHTGDAARLDEDGFAYIVDRIKDLFISGGENVYPAEVEKAILAVPDIWDCAVIGVPDHTWGEVGRAIVVPRPGAPLTEDDVLSALADRLAKYKIPKTVVFADSIPRSSTGKILKDQLRDRH